MKHFTSALVVFVAVLGLMLPYTPALALVQFTTPRGAHPTCDPTKGNQDCTFPSGNYSLCRQADFSDTTPGFYCLRCLATAPPAGQSSGGQYCAPVETDLVTCNTSAGSCVPSTPASTEEDEEVENECNPTEAETGCEPAEDCVIQGGFENFHYACVAQTTEEEDTDSGPVGNGTLINPLGVTSVEGLLTAVLRAVVQIGAILLVLALVWVGFLFVFAQGRSEEITKAKTALFWTIIGGLVLLGAEAISLVIQATVDGLGS